MSFIERVFRFSLLFNHTVEVLFQLGQIFLSHGICDANYQFIHIVDLDLLVLEFASQIRRLNGMNSVLD